MISWSESRRVCGVDLIVESGGCPESLDKATDDPAPV